MSDTAMKAAFMAAGYQTTEQKLNELMRQAIFAGKGKYEPSRDAFVAALTKEPEPAPLLWLLFEAASAQCVGRLFTKVLQQMRANGATKPAADAVASAVLQGQRSSAASAAGSDVRDPLRAEGAFKPVADAVAGAVPQGRDYSAASAAGSDVGEPRRATPPQLAAVENIARNLILDTMMIDGVPLRRAKVVDARVWGIKREVDGRFIRLLLADVPDRGVVGDHVSDAQAEQVRELAESAQNAAQ